MNPLLGISTQYVEQLLLECLHCIMYSKQYRNDSKYKGEYCANTTLFQRKGLGTCGFQYLWGRGTNGPGMLRDDCVQQCVHIPTEDTDHTGQGSTPKAPTLAYLPVIDIISKYDPSYGTRVQTLVNLKETQFNAQHPPPLLSWHPLPLGPFMNDTTFYSFAQAKNSQLSLFLWALRLSFNKNDQQRLQNIA